MKMHGVFDGRRFLLWAPGLFCSFVLGCSGDSTAPGSTADLAASVAAVDMSLPLAVPDAALDLASSVAPMDLATPDLLGPCPPTPLFNFQCDPNDPKTCPAGFCILGQCLAGNPNPHQWDGCGDGTCGPCENALVCPADCGKPPVLTGTKVYDDPNTITIWLHGFTNHGAAQLMNTVYGAVAGCGDVGDAAKTFHANIPCGNDPQFDKAPNQSVALEYYGAKPPAWMTAQDIAEVDKYPYIGGQTGLQRYGLIAAKFIKWRMAYTGATHVNLACHSMGCLITRYVIENDLEQLASSNKIVRWVTGAGVVAGAQLARLYNNPAIQKTADQIGLAVDDFALMQPDYVQVYAAPYDHKLWEANNPLYQGILMHHVAATNPMVAQALNVQLLNLSNPDQYPNDGIMYTFDEMFRAQAKAVQLKTPSGDLLAPTHSYIYEGHMEATAGTDFRAQLIAGLYHKRKVFITLDQVSLKKDHEFSVQTPLETGAPPAEVVAESEVRYDPYTMPKYGVTALVQNDKIAYWSPDLFRQQQATTSTPAQLVFAAPIFDDQSVLHLKLSLTETDYYLRHKVNEAILPGTSDKNLVTYEADLTLDDSPMGQVIHASGDGADMQLTVRVITLY